LREKRAGNLSRQALLVNRHRWNSNNFYQEVEPEKWLKPGAWGKQKKERTDRSAEVFALP
jgi:hypothetical protein